MLAHTICHDPSCDEEVEFTITPSSAPDRGRYLEVEDIPALCPAGHPVDPELVSEDATDIGKEIIG